MAAVSFRLRYTLTRRQRLGPHVMPWLPCLGASFGFTLGMSFLGGVVSPWFLPLLLLPVVICRRFFALVIIVAIRPSPVVELNVDTDTLKMTAGPDHSGITLDGIIQVYRSDPDTWTVLHTDGSAVAIPAAAIADDQLDYLKGFARRAAVFRRAHAGPHGAPSG